MTHQRIDHVRQRNRHDCGLACLAMAAGLSYDEGLRIFSQVGLSEPRGKKKPFSTNYMELRMALCAAGASPAMKRFTSWQNLGDLAILKIANKSTPKAHDNWHWVVAVRQGLPTPLGVRSIEVLDPDFELKGLEITPPDATHVTLEYFRPYGSYLEIAGAESP